MFNWVKVINISLGSGTIKYYVGCADKIQGKDIGKTEDRPAYITYRTFLVRFFPIPVFFLVVGLTSGGASRVSRCEPSCNQRYLLFVLPTAAGTFVYSAQRKMKRRFVGFWVNIATRVFVRSPYFSH